MGPIKIEGTPENQLEREPFDLRRKPARKSAAVCHAPFVALHVDKDGQVTPCRHSTATVGHLQRSSLREIWESNKLGALRRQFEEYRLQRKDCLRCISFWEHGLFTESPAVAEFDVLPEADGLSMPTLLALHASAPLKGEHWQEVRDWLPALKNLEVHANGSLPAPCLSLLEKATALKKEQRPKLLLRVENRLPDPADLPPGLDQLEIHLPASPLTKGMRKKLQAWRALHETGKLRLVVRLTLQRKTWFELWDWLREGPACIVPELDDGEKELQRLNANALATLHGILYRWSENYARQKLDEALQREWDTQLHRLRRWQQANAPTPKGRALALPAPSHPLLEDEEETLAFAANLLRVHHEDSIQQWLLQITQHSRLRKQADSRRSLRLLFLWRTCVFDDNSVYPQLREILKSRSEARDVLTADIKALKGTPWQHWVGDWVARLQLDHLGKRRRAFKIPPAQKPSTVNRRKVTVIIPSYNHEIYLGRAIESVLSQTHSNFRLLIVDDRSTDDTVKVARSFKDKRLQVLENSKNLGLGPSLKGAVQQVTTPFVAILNSDDLFHPERLERCLEALEDHPKAQLVTTGLTPINDNEEILAARDSSPIFDGRLTHQWLQWYDQHKHPRRPKSLLFSLLESNFLLTSSNLFVRRDFLLRHEDLWQGLEFCLDWQLFLLAALEDRLVYLPRSGLGYRLHSSNTVWFNEDRQWRYYLESNQVVARTLEALLDKNRNRANPAQFHEIVEAVADHLNANTSIDGTGVVLGLFLQRLGLHARDLGSKPLRGRLQFLDQVKRDRLEAVLLADDVGSDKGLFYRLQGERPFLESLRAAHGALGDELLRAEGELLGALHGRNLLEDLWHQAEAQRDYEIQGKAELYERIGELQGERERSTAERDEARQVSDQLKKERDHYQVEKDQAWQMEGEVRQQLADAMAQRDRERDAHQQQVRSQQIEHQRERQQEREHLKREMEEALHKKRVAALALENQLKDQTEEVQRQVEEVKRQVHEIQGLRQSMGSLQEQADRLQENLHQRTWERDELQRSPEFRVGHMLLNKARFRAPLRLLERAWIRLQHLWSLVRLRLEGSVLRRKRTLPYKGMATICWNFPIYSHTFVYQELTQLNRRGFDLRIVFSKLDPRPYLHKQFDHLWRMKRRMALHKSLYRVDRQYFQSKMPEKVEQITDMICKASGRDRDYVESHDNFLQAFSYARMVEAYGPDYLHSYFFYDRSLFSMVAAFLLDLPRGVSCYADHVMDDYEFKLVPLHMQTCDVVIATSKRIKRELLEVAPAADPDKILVKPNAVDAERFPVLERHEPAPGQPYRIVCVCRIEPKKGLTYLARAMALLRDRGVKVEAHIVGEADEGIQSSQDYRLRLCQVLDELDLWGTVHLEGRQELDGVRRFLEISQLFVAPFVETDSGDKDGIPTALLESMATGLPAVASDAGSIVEVITPDKDGLIVPMRDAEALADALQDLLQDPERRAAMSTAAAEKVRREFDVQVCEKWFHDRVIDLLAARRRPS